MNKRNNKKLSNKQLVKSFIMGFFSMAGAWVLGYMFFYNLSWDEIPAQLPKILPLSFIMTFLFVLTFLYKK